MICLFPKQNEDRYKPLLPVTFKMYESNNNKNNNNKQTNKPFMYNLISKI